MLRSIVCSLVLSLCAFVGSEAFALTPVSRCRVSTASIQDGSFVSRLPAAASLTVAQQGGSGIATSQLRTTRSDLRMGGKVSKFGIFSPAVIGAKVALGESRLNKLRGKVITLHSQVITEYCKWVGAPGKLRGLLIRKAKKNGDALGFLW